MLQQSVSHESSSALSTSEFFDAAEKLSQSSSSSEEEEEEGSFCSEVSDDGTEYAPGAGGDSGGRAPSTQGRRSKLPAPKPDAGDTSLWNLLCKNIGKDLSKVSMPVTINEPLNMLQRLCEELEYSDLLDKAASMEDPVDRMASDQTFQLCIAAFAVSGYSSSYHRAGHKPFNPLLGETYECIREDKGFRFIAEQVNHHPPVSACYAESKNYKFWQDVRIKSKFWGKSMEILPVGSVHLELFSSNSHYEWNKVTTCVHNIFSGQRWVDQYGEMTIRDLTYEGHLQADVRQVFGTVVNKQGDVVCNLSGQWTEALYCGTAPTARCIWRPGTMPEDFELYYGFTRFAIELNELDQQMAKLLPPTDSRFRPDQSNKDVRMRQSFTIEKKVEAVQWHRKTGSNVSKTARQFGVDRKQVRQWNSTYETLLQHCHGKGKFKRSMNNGRPVFSEEVDDGLFEFLQEERAAGRAKRFNVSLRAATSDSQKLPIDHAEAVSAFRRSVGMLRLQHDYSDHSIANMDQTMVRMDEPATRTNNITGEASIRIANTGCSRRGFTVALCATAAGIKLPAFIILKEPTGRIPPKVLFAMSIPANVRLSFSRNGWMTSDVLLEWVRRIWGPNEDDVRRLLVLDQAPIHKTDAARKAFTSKDTDVVYVPGGCTPILQPADVSWMKPFKDSLRETWAAFIRAGAVTPKGNLKKPSRQDVVSFVSKAWASVSEEVVARSFKHCGISTALDGSQDGELHERLASAITPSASLPTTSDHMRDEVIDILFDSDSDCSFEGFEDD
ncbi:hypothetical protein HPB47_002034 [Ixodes persulcatus]|uniref:Uncharacterized protein n=1 Tax=Ixodes persulcatus TaxID=34615 RepID=A0AC60PNI1_IXOPE|nr:hypothetical protein HPB47_002034 [Ixodes persulcatus]